MNQPAWQPNPGFGQPPPPGYGPPPSSFGPPFPPPGAPKPPRKTGKWVLIGVIVVVVMAATTVGLWALTRDSSSDSENESSDKKTSESEALDEPLVADGELIDVPGKPYTVRLPKDINRRPPRADAGIPSEVDARFEMADKPGQGGVVSVGLLAGQLQGIPLDEIATIMEENYSHYGDEPGGKINVDSTEIDNHRAKIVSFQFYQSGKEDDDSVTVFSRLYFVETSGAGGPIVFMACDWNNSSTPELPYYCEATANTIKIRDPAAPS